MAEIELDEPLLAPPSEPEKAEPLKSVPRVAVNLANAIVGAGIVGLPCALKDAGFGFGCVLLVAMALATHWSVGALVSAAELLGGDCRDYNALARRALGPRAEVAVLAGQFVFDVGAALTYLIILGDTSVECIKYGVQNPPGFLRPLCILGAALLMLPLCVLRDISSLEKTSALSILAVVVVAVSVCTKLAVSPRLSDATHVSFFAQQDEAGGVVTAVGVLAFAFVCQDSCFLFYNTLAKPSPQRFSAVTALALGGSAFLTLVFASAGYLCFRGDTEANLLNNYGPTDGAALLMRLLYALTMIFTYPTAVFVCRQAGHALQRAAGAARDCTDDVRRLSKRRHLAWSLGLWGSTVGVALATSDLGAVMALTGSVAGSLIGFVVPGLVAVAPAVEAARGVQSPAAVWGRRCAAMGLVVFGVVAAVLSVWVICRG